jgi:hypothetical protein
MERSTPPPGSHRVLANSDCIMCAPTDASRACSRVLSKTATSLVLQGDRAHDAGVGYAALVMPPVTSHRRLGAGAAAVVVLALVGSWLGHTLEYLRVDGGAGMERALLAGVHAYMLPAGILLALAAALAGVRCRHAWLVLGRRLDRARAALRGLARGERVVPSTLAPAATEVSAPAGLLALWLPLGAAQVAIYLVQENLEAVLAGAPGPGIGPVTGVHWAAAALQLGVALVLAAGLLAVGRLLRRRARTIERVERLLRLLWDRLLHGRRSPRGARAWRRAPVERFGHQLWSRPPPALR